jgi:hypothetical protein
MSGSGYALDIPATHPDGGRAGVLGNRQRHSDPAASMAARPASSRATGSRNGEQDT